MAYTGTTVNPASNMADSFIEDSKNNVDLGEAHQEKIASQQTQAQQAEFDSLVNSYNSSQEGDAQSSAQLSEDKQFEQLAAQNGQTPQQPEAGQQTAQTQPQPNQQQPQAQQPAQADDESTAMKVLKDVGRGSTEIVGQTLGGMADAVNNTIDATQDIADWLNKNVVDLGGIGWDKDGIHLTSGKELAGAEQPRLPTTGQADSVTGAGIRSIAQFLTGFVTAGRLLGPVGEAGKIGTLAKGAVSDFSVFDPSQENLSNVIQSVPSLENPITDFMAHKEGDSRVEDRIKNTLEGAGLGVVTDGLIKGLRGYRVVRDAVKKAGGVTEEASKASKIMIDSQPTIDHEEIAKNINGGELPTEKAVDDAHFTYKGKAGKTFVNWARLDTDDDVKNTIQELANRGAQDISSAARGKQSFAQTELNAESLDAWKILEDRRVSNKAAPLNAEQSLAVRQLWASSGDNVTRLAKQANVNPSESNLFALRKAMAIHHAIQTQVIAARTETARALSAWRIPAGATRLNDLGDIINQVGGVNANRKLAARISMLADNGCVKEMDELVNKSAWAKTSDAIRQAWMNGLLSSPHTHIRNMISQTATIGQQMYERKAAQLMSQVFGYQSAVPDGEVSQMMSGLSSGLRDAFSLSAKNRTLLKTATKQMLTDPEGAKALIRDSDVGTFWKSLATGESGFGVGKIESQQGGAFSAEAWNQSNDSALGKALNMIDTFTQVPGRALSVSDEVFKTAAYRMELQARAAQMAGEEVSAGKIAADGLKDRMAQIIENPPEDLKGNLQDFAKYVTFQDTPDNTRIWDLWKAVNRIPVLGKIVLPFSRTPYNIARYSFERTPLAPFVGRWRADFAAGGARREMATARMATGSAILLTMADAAMSGHITGEGPDSYAQKQAMQRMGWQANSVKVPTSDGGTRYFSYTGLDPISTPMLLASNVVDILANSEPNDNDSMTEKAIVAASMAIANQVTSQQYMSGVSSFFAMMQDPQRYGDTWWKRLASSTVPSGLAYIKQTDDPYARYAFNLIDSVKARIPGLSKDLPVRRDVWGRPVDYRSGLGDLYDFISPIYSSKSHSQPIDEELNRLQLYIPMPQKSMVVSGIPIDLTQYPKAYSRYVELAGNALTKDQYGIPIDPVTGKGLMDSLNALVSGKSPLSIEYNLRSDGPDGDKANMIHSMVTKYRDAAKQEILKEFPEINAEYNIKKANMRANDFMSTMGQ